MVGDGINDSQALAQADVSVAMGSGSDIAKSSSDITLTNSSLSSISSSIKLSKKVYRYLKNILTTFWDWPKVSLFWLAYFNIIFLGSYFWLFT